MLPVCKVVMQQAQDTAEYEHGGRHNDQSLSSLQPSAERTQQAQHMNWSTTPSSQTAFRHLEVAVTTKCRSGRTDCSLLITASLPTPLGPLMTASTDCCAGTCIAKEH